MDHPGLAAGSLESRLKLQRTDLKVRIWRQPQETMDPAIQVGTAQDGGGSMLIWGVFSWMSLVRVQSIFTAFR